jgi:hypothetical protein
MTLHPSIAKNDVRPGAILDDPAGPLWRALPATPLKHAVRRH